MPAFIDKFVITANTCLMVNVVLTAEAVHDFSVLPTVITVRMRRLVARLRQWPDVSGVKHLKGNLAGKHRLRTGGLSPSVPR